MGATSSGPDVPVARAGWHLVPVDDNGTTDAQVRLNALRKSTQEVSDMSMAFQTSMRTFEEGAFDAHKEAAFDADNRSGIMTRVT